MVILEKTPWLFSPLPSDTAKALWKFIFFEIEKEKVHLKNFILPESAHGFSHLPFLWGIRRGLVVFKSRNVGQEIERIGFVLMQADTFGQYLAILLSHFFFPQTMRRCLFCEDSSSRIFPDFLSGYSKSKCDFHVMWIVRNFCWIGGLVWVWKAHLSPYILNEYPDW